MKHIKRFFESKSTTSDDIKEIVKECFEDYMIDYGMIVNFCDGKYIPGYNFMSNRLLHNLQLKYPKESKKFEGNYKKCIKVDFNNDGIGSGERFEIYLDENSQNLFDESIHNLHSQLKLITSGFQLIDVPKYLSSDFYGIGFLILYEDF